MTKMNSKQPQGHTWGAGKAGTELSNLTDNRLLFCVSQCNYELIQKC